MPNINVVNMAGAKVGEIALSDVIFGAEVNATVLHTAVRAFLLETQKEIARHNSVIMDGRDIGTVILPNADVKIFMFASPEARARRRFDELQAKGQNVKFEDVLSEMNERDSNDRNRATAPAVPAEDAVMFDNSDVDLEGSIKYVIDLVLKKCGDKL